MNMNGRVLVINGPTLNMIHKRDPKSFGGMHLCDLENYIQDYGKHLGLEVDCFQSNSEGEIVDRIQEAEGVYDGIVINPGPFTQYSHSIRVALKTTDVISVEVHLINIHNTPETTVPGKGCTGVIAGFGVDCYLLGVDAVYHMLLQKKGANNNA